MKRLAFGNRLNVVFSKLIQFIRAISQAALLKLPKKLKLTEVSTRLGIGYLVVLVTVVLFIMSVKLFITNLEKFRLEAPFIISCIATIGVVVSVMLALRSLEATENALKITRAVMRPFLALQAGDVPSKQIQQIVVYEFHTENTGSVPANVVSMEMAFFDDAEVIEEDNTGKHYGRSGRRHEKPEGVVIFPGAVYNFELAFDLSNSSGKKLYNDMQNGKVKLRFRVKYRAQGMEYLTVQTEKLLKAAQGEMTRLPIQPQRWT